MDWEFQAEVFQWRGPAPYFFVTTPEDCDAFLHAHPKLDCRSANALAPLRPHWMAKLRPGGDALWGAWRGARSVG